MPWPVWISIAVGAAIVIAFLIKFVRWTRKPVKKDALKVGNPLFTDDERREHGLSCGNCEHYNDGMVYCILNRSSVHSGGIFDCYEPNDEKAIEIKNASGESFAAGGVEMTSGGKIMSAARLMERLTERFNEAKGVSAEDVARGEMSAAEFERTQRIFWDPTGPRPVPTLATPAGETKISDALGWTVPSKSPRWLKDCLKVVRLRVDKSPPIARVDDSDIYSNEFEELQKLGNDLIKLSEKYFITSETVSPEVRKKATSISTPVEELKKLVRTTGLLALSNPAIPSELLDELKPIVEVFIQAGSRAHVSNRTFNFLSELCGIIFRHPNFSGKLLEWLDEKMGQEWRDSSGSDATNVITSNLIYNINLNEKMLSETLQLLHRITLLPIGLSHLNATPKVWRDVIRIYDDTWIDFFDDEEYIPDCIRAMLTHPKCTDEFVYEDLFRVFIRSEPIRDLILEHVDEPRLVDAAYELGDYIVVDEDKGYAIIDMHWGDGVRRRFLKMDNPSTGEVHIEGIPPNTETINDSMIWRNKTEEIPSVIS